ncbi:MAG: hypothetical protein IKO42_07475, partial [Opitutales bacterium]|nr:hypothetical protein [Opitutales bacterium]
NEWLGFENETKGGLLSSSIWRCVTNYPNFTKENNKRDGKYVFKLDSQLIQKDFNGFIKSREYFNFGKLKEGEEEEIELLSDDVIRNSRGKYIFDRRIDDIENAIRNGERKICVEYNESKFFLNLEEVGSQNGIKTYSLHITDIDIEYKPLEKDYKVKIKESSLKNKKNSFLRYNTKNNKIVFMKLDQSFELMLGKVFEDGDYKYTMKMDSDLRINITWTREFH